MENVLFNQSLFGFDRGQVLKYIDDMSAPDVSAGSEYAKKQTDLQEEIEKLSGQVSRISDEFSILPKCRKLKMTYKF